MDGPIQIVEKALPLKRKRVEKERNIIKDHKTNIVYIHRKMTDRHTDEYFKL